MKTLTTKKIALLSLFTVLVYVMTLINLPAPAGGYIHFGDAAIFFAASVLSFYSVIPAVIGSAFADLTLGAAVYIPATVIIKAAMAAVYCLITGGGKKTWQIILGTVIAGLIMIVSYTLYEYMLLFLGNPFDNTVSDVFLPLNLFFNAFQAGAAIPVTILIIKATASIPMLKRTEELDVRENADDSGGKDG